MKREQLVSEFIMRFDRLFQPLRLDAWEAADGLIQLSVSLKRKRFEVLCAVEYRPTPGALKLRAATLRAEARQRRHKGGVGVLAAHVSRPSFAACEALGLACFDLAGTCLLDQRGAYIKVLAPASQKGQMALELGAAFVGNRANVVRALLADRHQIWSISSLAECALVSGGQVSKAIKPLAVAGFVEAKRGKGGIHVLSPGAILDAWADHYAAPGTALNYTSRDSVEQLEQRLAGALNAAQLPYAFTGFSGNALLAASGRYNEVSAYVVAPEAKLQRLAVDLGLFPALDTPKLVLRAVSDAAVLVGATTMVVAGSQSRVAASPAQVYLDLLKHVQRGPEAAALLRTLVMKY